MNAELQAAIEELYRVFGRYPLNPNMDFSPAYGADGEAWNRSLAATPLRELTTEEELGIFYFKVMTTWGDVADFKHFLPRIFELLAGLRSSWDEWVAFDKLNYGNWRTWSKQEQAAIEAYLWALWNELLTTPAKLINSEISFYFHAIANVYPDLPALLRRWEQAQPLGLIRLGGYVYWNFTQLSRRQRLSDYNTRPDLGPVVLEWLATNTVLAKLEDAFFAATDPHQAEQVSEAVQLLEAWRKRCAVD